MPRRFRSPKKRERTMRTLQQATPDVRVVLFLRSGGHCWYCGVRMTLKTLSPDHVVPVKHGGQAVLENLVASCSPCNQEKVCLSLEAYRALKGEEAFWGERLPLQQLPAHRNAQHVLPRVSATDGDKGTRRGWRQVSPAT